MKCLAHLTLDHLLVHCRATFSHIHRRKAASRDRPQVADKRPSRL